MQLPSALRNIVYVMQYPVVSILIALALLLCYALLGLGNVLVWVRREMSPISRVTMTLLTVLLVASTIGTYVEIASREPVRSSTPQAAAVTDPGAHWVTDATHGETAEQALAVYGATMVSAPSWNSWDKSWVFSIDGRDRRCQVKLTGPAGPSGTPAILLCDGVEPARVPH